MLWVNLEPFQRPYNAVTQPRPRVEHHQYRQGDEIACSCGKRWPVGEDHP